MQTLSWVQSSNLGRVLPPPKRPLVALHAGNCPTFRECRTDFQFIVWPRRSPPLERVKNRCSHSQPTTFLKPNKQSTYNVSYQEILTTVLQKVWYLNWVCPPWDWYCRLCYPEQVSAVAPIPMLHEISLTFCVGHTCTGSSHPCLHTSVTGGPFKSMDLWDPLQAFRIHSGFFWGTKFETLHSIYII